MKNNRKSKTIALFTAIYCDQHAIYVFIKFGWGRLNSGGDRRARYTGRGICSYIELLRSTLHKTGDLQVGNWHDNCQHSSFTWFETRWFQTETWWHNIAIVYVYHSMILNHARSCEAIRLNCLNQQLQKRSSVQMPCTSSFVSRYAALLIHAFIVYVRTLGWLWLPYPGILSPQNVHGIEQTERVHRRLTKLLSGLQMYSPAARLSQLNLSSFELWRLYVYFIICYKIILNLIHVKFDDFFTTALLWKHEAIRLNCLSNIVMLENRFSQFLVNSLSKSGIVCHHRLSTLVHYDYLKGLLNLHFSSLLKLCLFTVWGSGGAAVGAESCLIMRFLFICPTLYHVSLLFCHILRSACPYVCMSVCLSVCVFVCLLAYFNNHTYKFHLIFCTYYCRRGWVLVWRQCN